MNEQQRAELERIRDVLYPATGLEDYDEEIIGRVLKDIKTLLAQDAQPKQDVPETNFGNMAEPKIGCVNHDCDQCKAVQEPVRECNSVDCQYIDGLGKTDCDWCRPKKPTTPPAPQPVPVKTYHDGKPWPVAPKPWVGLTDEDIRPLCKQSWVFYTVKQWAEIIEAKLKEKNHG
jgi:hypothetical protein